jgi:hypothetical protein
MTIQLFAESFSDELLQRARLDVCGALEMVCRYQASPERTLQQWAGVSLNPMKENLSALLDALRHPNPQVRRASLFVIRDYWPELEELVSECLRVGFEDSDLLTRGIALHVLSRFYGWIADPSGVLGKVLWSYEAPDDFQATESIAVLKETNAFHVAVLQQRRSEWQEVIGPQFNEMLRDRMLAERYMQAADTNLRYVAVAMMSCDWKPTQQAAAIAKTLAVQDSDPRVRKAAVAVVMIYYAGTKNNKVTKLLADIVSDDRQPAEIRQVAYQGLFQVRGLPMGMWPIVTTAPNEFQIPHDIDWTFVNSMR